jgi:hypothetical protein
MRQYTPDSRSIKRKSIKHLRRDRDLPLADQAELFSEQALQDTDVALIRLFQGLAEIEQIEFQVLKPDGLGDAILAGVVDRGSVLAPERSHSLRMRLRNLGITCQLPRII